MHQNLRIEILKRFRTQADFAAALKKNDSVVSRVVQGRRRLSKIESELWQKTLKCKQELLKPVTQQ